MAAADATVLGRRQRDDAGFGEVSDMELGQEEAGGLLNLPNSDGDQNSSASMRQKLGKVNAKVPWKRRAELAASQGDLEQVEQLLEQRADINAKLDWERTMLHLAAREGHPKLVRCLLAERADPHAVELRHRTPLALAAQCRKEPGKAAAVIKHLVEQRADPNHEDVFDRTPLHLAMEGEVVTALIHCRADPLNTDLKNRTPLHLLMKYGSTPEAVQALLQGRAELEREDALGHTPLHLGALNGNVKLVEVLIAWRANVNCSGTKNKRTPLHMAAEGGHKETVELLIARGSENRPNHQEQLPLHLAAEHGNAAVVKVLLDKFKGTVDANDRHGQTPLIMAAYGSGTADVVAVLAAAGADLSARDHQVPCRSAIAAAAEQGNVEMFLALMEKGVHLRPDELAALIRNEGEDSAQVMLKLLNEPSDFEWRKQASKLRMAYLRSRMEVAVAHCHPHPGDVSVRDYMERFVNGFKKRGLLHSKQLRCSLQVIECMTAEELIDPVLVEAMAYTPSGAVLATPATCAILSMAWRTVMLAFIIDYAIKGAAVGALIWAANCLANGKPIPLGPVVMLALKLCKQGLDVLAQLYHSVDSGHAFHVLMSIHSLRALLALALDGLALRAMALQASSVFWTSILAAEALSVWVVFASGMNLLPSLGEELLPIIDAFHDSWHFFVLLALATSAWIHSFYILAWQLNGPDVYTNAFPVLSVIFTGQTQPNDFEGINHNYQLDNSSSTMVQTASTFTQYHTAVQILYFAIILSCNVVLLNILIGVLSSHYTERRAQSRSLFCRHRAKKIILLRSSPVTKALRHLASALKLLGRKLDPKKDHEVSSWRQRLKSWLNSLAQFLAWTPEKPDYIWVCQALELQSGPAKPAPRSGDTPGLEEDLPSEKRVDGD